MTLHITYLLRLREEYEVLRSSWLYVYLFICPLAYLKNHTLKLHEISLQLTWAPVTRSCSDVSAIRYVLPVL